MNNFKVVKKWWFNTLKGTIGILQVKNTLSREIYFYVGIIDGNDIKKDIQSILDFGQKFHPIDLL